MKRTRIDKSSAVEVRATESQRAGWKPVGFWYSVEGGWEGWCREERPDWLEGRNEFEVILGDERMVFVRTVAEMDEFHERFKAGGSFHSYEADQLRWDAVAAEYDGIEVAPYLWDRRLYGGASRWYYGWDCASGCIWRPRGVEVRLLKEAR